MSMSNRAPDFKKLKAEAGDVCQPMIVIIGAATGASAVRTRSLAEKVGGNKAGKRVMRLKHNGEKKQEGM